MTPDLPPVPPGCTCTTTVEDGVRWYAYDPAGGTCTWHPTTPDDTPARSPDTAQRGSTHAQEHPCGGPHPTAGGFRGQ